MRRRWWVAGLALAALIVILLSPFTSPDPDGLERVATDHGFLGTAQRALFDVLPDYAVPGLDDPALTTVAAGLIGIGIVFALTWGLGTFLARRRGHHDGEPS